MQTRHSLSIDSIFISRLESDSFVSFLYGWISYKNADSSNQRDFFLHGSLVLRICLIKSVKRVTARNLRNKCKVFFLQRSCLFVHMSVSCLLNYESKVCREIIAESLP